MIQIELEVFMARTLMFTRYLRYLELTALCVGIALAIFTGVSMKWVGFSRVFGMYVGMFFPPLALLELCALGSEKYASDRTVTRSTIVATIVWSLIVVVFAFIMMSRVVEWRLRFDSTSDTLSRLFPDNFKDLLGMSSMVVCLWLVPLLILNGFLGVLKRRGEQGIRDALILWQASLLVVVGWCALFQMSLKSKIVNVAGSYFTPLDIHIWGRTDANVIVSLTLVLVYWSVLFFAIRYAVKHFDTTSTLGGLVVSVLLASGLIFIPHIPNISQRWISFVGEGGWYDLKTPGLLPPRIWVASLMLLGGILCFAGLIWLLRRNKSTVPAG